MTSIRSYFIILALALLLQLADATEPVLKVAKPHNKVNDTKDCRSEDCQQSTTMLADSSASQNSLTPELVQSAAHTQRTATSSGRLNIADGLHEPIAFITLTEEEKRKQQVLAVAKIERFCKNARWLACETKSDGTYNIDHGEVSVVVFGLLHNDGKHGVTVYRNSEMGSSEGSLKNIHFDPHHLVPAASEPIPIVIKVNTPLAEKNNLKMFFPETTALEKEVRRGRLAAKFEFREGEPIFPDIYDIRTAAGEAHPIHEVAYIQKRLDGSPALRVLNKYLEEETKSMKAHLQLTLDHFSRYLGAVKAESVKSSGEGKVKSKDLSYLGGGALASLARGEFSKMKTAKELHSIFQETAQKAIKELWLRARPRVSLISFVYANAFKMWKHVLNCDSHWGNVYLIRDVIHSEEQLIKAKQDHSVMIQNEHVRLSDPSISPAEKAQLKNGITVYRFQPNHINWIDPAYALTLDPILDEIRKETPSRNPEDLLFSPCIMYREIVLDDVVGLHHGGGVAALGDYKQDYMTLYTNATDQLVRGSIAYQIYKTYSDSLHHYQRKQFDHSPLAESADQPYLDSWKELFSTLETFDTELKHLDSIFKRALSEAKRLTVAQACDAIYSKARTQVESFRTVARNPSPWKDADKLVPKSCSLGGMKSVIKDTHKILGEAVDQFHDYAKPLLFGYESG